MYIYKYILNINIYIYIYMKHIYIYIYKHYTLVWKAKPTWQSCFTLALLFGLISRAGRKGLRLL